MKYLVTFFVPILFLAFPSFVEAKLLINEVLPNPTSANDSSEWIELYNDGDSAVDLRDYTIDGKRLNLGEPVLVAPASYIVVTKSMTAFLAEFGAVSHLVELGISLGNSGDQVSIAGATAGGDSTESETITFGSSSDNRSWERKGRFCSDLVKHPTSNSVGKANLNTSADCATQKRNFDVQLSLDQVNWVKGLKSRGETKIFARTTLTDNTPVIFYLDDESEFTLEIKLNSYFGKISGCVSTTNCFASEQVTIVPNLQVVEVMPNPEGTDTDKEWVKIFNPTNQNISLANIRLQDGVGDLVEFELDDKVEANSSITISLSGSPLLNCANPGCSEKVKLVIGEEIIDEMSYTKTQSGVAWRRQGNVWTLAPETSPAAAPSPNSNVSPPPISSSPTPMPPTPKAPLIYPTINLTEQKISGKFIVTHKYNLPIAETILIAILFILNLIFVFGKVWEKLVLVLIRGLRPIWLALTDTPHVIVLASRQH